MNAEFGRLAAARRMMGVPPATGSPADRADAERWIRRFGGVVDPGDGASAEHTGSSLVVRPAQEDPAAPYVLYIHGGGLVYYSTATFEPFLRTLATRLHAPVEAFDYLKAPENSVAESVALLAKAVAARCAEPDRPLVLAGDSVGGLLSLYLALRVLPGTFSRLVLIYPVLDLSCERPSYEEFGEGYFLDRTAMRRFAGHLRPLGFDPFTEDLAALPDCVVVTAGCDVLRDEGLAWAERAGARHRHFADLPHDFCLYGGKLASARAAVAEIAGCFR